MRAKEKTERLTIGERIDRSSERPVWRALRGKTCEELDAGAILRPSNEVETRDGKASIPLRSTRPHWLAGESKTAHLVRVLTGLALFLAALTWLLLLTLFAVKLAHAFLAI